MADSEAVPVVYFVVSNIPAMFRSADLRNYFSQFIESGGFHCFHYRHRPERLREAESQSAVKEDQAVVEGEASEEPSSDSSSSRKEPSSDSSSSRKEPSSDSSSSRKEPSSDSSSSRKEPSSDSSSSRKEPSSDSSSSKKEASKSCCCVAAVRARDAERFFKMYSGNHWIDKKGSWLSRRCVIRRVKVSQKEDEDLFPYKTKFQQRHRVSTSEHFTRADLRSLSELNPPALMQNGNVGTPIKVFLQLIQSCRLPPRLIRKLGLAFPKTSSNRRYGNVHFQYWDTDTMPATEDTILTAAGHEIAGPGVLASRSSSGKKEEVDETTSEPEREEDEEGEEEGSDDVQSNADDDDDRCEEWERHEALHEDVTSQERCKERLFEEEIELKWEKGGSGLVFYTDAQYWQEEEGDFDEQTTDDWDVDMSVYYDKDGGDMDARDFMRMRYEKRLREGLEDGAGHNQAIGNFEKFTKGFGRRLMESQGWKDGEGLGNSQVGISDALESEGQHPHCKRGFGYHGEKLQRFNHKKPKTDFLITTVYDKPKDIDEGDTLQRRQPNTSMKYREWQQGGSIGLRR